MDALMFLADMAPKAAMALGYPLGIGLAGLGSGIGLGFAVNGALNAMGRQPEKIGDLQINMIIGAAFIEAIAIYALISIYLMSGKVLAP